MRKYEKGSRVEVLRRSRERAAGCWRAGEVIGGNGRFYIVKFDGFQCCGSSSSLSPLVQAVRAGSIRPCPPVVKVGRLRCGDVVEVLVDFDWESATVSRVMRNGFVWVMLGGVERVKVRKGDVRIKQAWLNDEWVVDKQRSRTPARGKKTSTINLMCKSEIMQTHEQNNLKGPDVRIAAKKTNNATHQTRLKRKSLCANNPETCCEVTRKSRAIEKDGLVVRAPVVTQSPVAADQGSRYLSRKTQAQTRSFWGKLWFSKANPVEENPFDTDTTLSSVGSCSVTSHGIHVLHHHALTPECSQVYDGYISDAESVCGCSSGEKNIIQPIENTAFAGAQRYKAISCCGRQYCNMFLKLILVFSAYALLR